MSLQARQASLSTAVSRLLIANNESEQAAAARTQELYAGAERNVYIFLAAMLVVIVLTSLYLVQYNRGLFKQVATLSERRSELAQQLISLQESTFRSISLELHDDIGQILTAIGAMLQRADRKAGDLLEVVEDRVGLRSTIVTSQLPVALWHEALGEPTLADAILDRLLHSAHRIEMQGESMRKTVSRAAGDTPMSRPAQPVPEE